MQLRHYYHIYADGDYRHIVREHAQALYDSDLIANLSKLHFGIVGHSSNVSAAIDLLMEIIPDWDFSWNTAPEGFEQETQDVLWRDCVEAVTPFHVLYGHTKGAWSQSTINEVWRRAMVRSTVKKWKRAVSKLEGNIGAAGPFWAPFNNGVDLGITTGTQYFAGTFWWAKSEAIAKIGPPERSSRWGAESWIGKITTLPEPYDVFNLLDVPLTVQTLRPHSLL